MAASVQQINVSSKGELDSTITSYIAQGFAVVATTPESATLFKKKEFNIVWALIGFFLCILPLLVYCVVYATQNDEMVTIKVVPPSPETDEVTWSEDRQWWWDGSRWRDTQLELPPGTVLSDDQRTWWDGKEWRPVPKPGAESEVREGAPAPPADA